MQITLNTAEVSDCVLAYVQAQLGLDDSNNFVVELHEDGITVLVNEDQSDEQPKPAGEKPARKPRQSRKPKDTPTPAAEVATTNTAVVETANVVVEPVTDTPSTVVDSTVGVVEEQAQEPVPETDPEPAGQTPVEEPEVGNAEEEQEVKPKPTTSLFANLRKPNNQ